MTFEPQVLSSSDTDELNYVYNYQFIVYLFNKCFQQCLSNLANQAMQPENVSQPYFTFDTSTQLFTLHLDTNYGYNQTNKLNVYFNYASYGLFASLPFMNCNKNRVGMDWQINPTMALDPTTLIQEQSTIGVLSPVSSIVFTSSLLPISQSATPPIQLYQNGSLLTILHLVHFYPFLRILWVIIWISQTLFNTMLIHIDTYH